MAASDTNDESTIAVSLLQIEQEIIQNHNTPQRKFQAWADEISRTFARLIVSSIRVLQADNPDIIELSVATFCVGTHLATTKAFLSSLNFEDVELVMMEMKRHAVAIRSINAIFHRLSALHTK